MSKQVEIDCARRHIRNCHQYIRDESAKRRQHFAQTGQKLPEDSRPFWRRQLSLWKDKLTLLLQ